MKAVLFLLIMGLKIRTRQPPRWLKEDVSVYI